MTRTTKVLASGLGGMGVLHFVAPKPFDDIIPKWMPGSPRMWTYASGIAELASAALLAYPRTRRIGGVAAALTFIAVYPANLQMSIDNPPNTTRGKILLARLPLQFPMIAAALTQVRR